MRKCDDCGKPKGKNHVCDFQDVADRHARITIASIRDQVEAMEHAESCEEQPWDEETKEGCKVGSETRRIRVECGTCNASGKLATDYENAKAGDDCPDCKGSGKKWIHQQIHENPEAWHDRDAAREAIEQDPLSVEVRGDWHTPGDEEGAQPTEYNILLGTGGPAMRIIGDLNQYNQPESAHYEYQDWFKPWTRARLSGAEEDILLKYAQVFYYGD